jgi:hypothetical protein
VSSTGTHKLYEAHARFAVLTAVGMKSYIFWDITPFNPLKVNRGFGGTCRFHLHLSLAFTQVSYLGYFSTLKMEATCYSKTSVDFQKTTQRFIPEDRTPKFHFRVHMSSPLVSILS